MNKIIVVVVIIIVIAGLVYNFRVSAPPIVVSYNFPPPGTQGGKYVYFIGGGFEWNDGSFSKPSVRKVIIQNFVGASIGDPMTSEPAWSVKVMDQTKNVVAEGAYVPWVAVKFTDFPPDVSYSLGEMVVTYKFDYTGWFWNRKGVETTQKFTVPVPYPLGATPVDQVMDDENYRSFYEDYDALIEEGPGWYAGTDENSDSESN